MRTSLKLLFALIPLAVMIVALEIVLQTTHLFGAYVSWAIPDSNLGFRYAPGDHYWFFREAKLKTNIHVNRFGWVGPEWSQKKASGYIRIAVLGDSFLEAMQVSRPESAAVVAERILRERFGPDIELITFGRSGFSQTEQLMVLQTEVMQFDPDLIVNFFFSGNDIADSTRKTTSDTLRPFYTQSANGQLIFDNSFNNGYGYRLRVLMDPLKRRSALLSLTLQAYNALKRRRFDESLQHQTAHGYLSLCTGTPDLDFRASYELTRRLLETEATFAHRHGLPFLLVTLDNPAYQPQVAQEIRKDAQDFDPYCIEKDMERLSSQLDLYHLGLQSVFTEAYSRNGVELHWPLDGHWNVEGNRIAGQSLAQKLTTILKCQSLPASAPAKTCLSRTAPSNAHEE